MFLFQKTELTAAVGVRHLRQVLSCSGRCRSQRVATAAVLPLWTQASGRGGRHLAAADVSWPRQALACGHSRDGACHGGCCATAGEFSSPSKMLASRGRCQLAAADIVLLKVLDVVSQQHGAA